MSHLKRSASGHLLTKLAIAAGLLIIMGLIAVPGIARMRTQVYQRQCISNMMAIVAAKEHYAIDYDLKSGVEVPLEKLTEHSQDLLTPPKLCPEGGNYSVNPLGVFPSCSIGPPHVIRLEGRGDEQPGDALSPY